MKIAAVCGQLNSGKGVISNLLVSEFGYASMGFADPLKRILQQMFKIPDVVLWGPSSERTGKVRTMLQELGTDFGRKYDPNIWVNLTIQRIKHWNLYGEDTYGLLPYVGWDHPFTESVVISDLRFPNEAENLCFNWATKIFKVIRPDNFDNVDASEKQRTHVSETIVDDIPKNLITTTLYNDKDLAHLFTIAREAICTHLQ